MYFNITLLSFLLPDSTPASKPNQFSVLFYFINAWRPKVSWVWGLPWNMVDFSGVILLEKTGSSSPNSYQLTIYSQVEVGLHSCLPFPCYNFICHELARVSHALLHNLCDLRCTITLLNQSQPHLLSI